MHTPPHPHSHLSRVYLPDSNLTSRGSWAGGHGTLEVGRKQTIRPLKQVPRLKSRGNYGGCGRVEGVEGCEGEGEVSYKGFA